MYASDCLAVHLPALKDRLAALKVPMGEPVTAPRQFVMVLIRHNRIIVQCSINAEGRISAV
ncbi:MAG TPA: hypothetical protein DCS82_11435 [Rhodospirillaceae bacterium]|nr:hypothetical protein [Rhodospirillaceae bacterium]HAT36322.1 hypothetical protein [Rhodospirillaceae bacterium]